MSTVIDDSPIPFLPLDLSLEIMLSMASCTMASDSASSALVASSSRRIFGRRTSALAIAILCFCPPLSWTPRSPTSVSYFIGRLSMNDAALAKRAASSISCIVGSSSVPSNPYTIFRLIDLAKRVGS
mmetsp:Transcript_8715/g.10925  ORF Transcript_8715/g.10925 Transcript_8715/m.10925 type:complete len:127 (-) Transcript_8715:693-1073(-)